MTLRASVARPRRALCQRANDAAAAKRIFDRIANILDGRLALFD
jgi:hypothetical protein